MGVLGPFAFEKSFFAFLSVGRYGREDRWEYRWETEKITNVIYGKMFGGLVIFMR